MQDVTAGGPQEKVRDKASSTTKTPVAEYATCVLIAAAPASILIALLKVIGISGALIPLVLYFGGAALVCNYRKSRGKVATWKTALYAFLILAAVVVLLPALLIGLFF